MSGTVKLLRKINQLEAERASALTDRENARRLLHLALPYLVDMQAAAALTDNQHYNDESGEAYDAILGLVQAVMAELGL